MRIFVTENGETKVNLHLPTGLLLNPFSATIAPVFMKAEDGTRYTGEQLRKAVQELREYIKNHPEWVMVEVDTHTGGHVEIKL
ncbi:MAG: hypothetical protein IKJ51_04415 [Clostridia bacterium]|nr:hypothetical protein [Clostridia bacterium]